MGSTFIVFEGSIVLEFSIKFVDSQSRSRGRIFYEDEILLFFRGSIWLFFKESV